MYFKKIIFILLSVLSLTLSFNVLAVDTCTKLNGVITNTTECSTKPDTQIVTFYKAYLCKEKPEDPTTSTPINLSSCGQPVFQSSGGAEVQIQQGVINKLTNGDFIKPPNGSYRYIYVEISTTMSVATVQTFSTTRYNTDKSSSGSKCWTLNAINYSARASTTKSTECGTTAPQSIGYNIFYINTLDGSDNTNKFIYRKNFTTSQNKILSAFMLQSDNKLASGASNDQLGTVSKLVGYIPQDIEINDSISELIVNYNNYQGTSVALYNDGSRDVVDSFSGGSFDLYITAQ